MNNNILAPADILNESTGNTIELMLEDTPVLTFDLSTGELSVINESLLPFGLKNKLNHPAYNSMYIMDWLASRTLLLSRANAKKLYQAFRIEQSESTIHRAQLAIACRALSILDNYWVRYTYEELPWRIVNIRHHSLNTAIAQVALHGTTVSLQGSMVSPEFTTNGCYAKAWHRDEDCDDELWLYKLNDKDDTARIEVMVSRILDHMNVPHVHYEMRKDNGADVCACPSIAGDVISIADASTMIAYYQRLGLDPISEFIKMDADMFYKMMVVDYLIANPDRHSQNWGVWYLPDTMKIVGIHALFDHNNAFDKTVMYDEDYKSHFYHNKSLKEVAMMAVKRTDIHFIGPLTKDMFLTKEQCEVFATRAKQLKLNVTLL